MSETHRYTNVEQFHDAMRDQRDQMEDVIDSAQHAELRDPLLRLNEAIKENYPYDHMAVITGEQPYGALGGTKVLAKRVLAQTLAETYEDVTTIEMFANQDLVGSEPGFFRLVIPTVGAEDGAAKINMLSGKLRDKGVTANGVLLPNKTVQEQVNKARSVLRHHYPPTRINGETYGYDPEVVNDWAGSYGIDEEGNFDEGNIPENYADAHIRWLTQFEQKIGLEMDHVAREGDLDLLLARNGGIDVLQSVWQQGLHNLRDQQYEPVALKLEDEALTATPFNLEHEGVRLQTLFINSDHSLIEAVHPITKETIQLTMDEALSGQYGFSFKAVPRVVLYSLAGMDGHITGGGSVYNADARHFMDSLELPYFPIVHMAAKDGDTKISTLQYRSLALTRKSPEEAEKLVRSGKVSLLDLAISCHFEEVKDAIDATVKQGGELSPGHVITLPNKAQQLPNV